MGGNRVMLPLWWPRTACIYCGARIPDVRPYRLAASGTGTRERAILRAILRAQLPQPNPAALACDRHVPLVACDPLTAP